MHAGRSYKFTEFVFWTRRSLYVLIALNLLVVALYQLAGWKWLALPWSVIFMLGTTVALTAGFKNTQTYNRLWEAQQVWASITGMSRLWGVMSRDYVGNDSDARRLVYRHLAWLTTLRYQMRDSKAWETQQRAPNVEYRKHYGVPERERALELELIKYVSPEEKSLILMAPGKATEVLGLQSAALKALLDAGRLPASSFAELQRVLREFQDQQARSERLKNYPYPRQYAIINVIFVRILCLLLPMGMIDLLAPVNAVVGGTLAGQMAWLAIPLSVLVSWMYAALDQVGESSANPFEGGANDIPISQICTDIETDLRQLLGERDVPQAVAAASPIVL
ncbi:MAG TPA: bestrophin family ion channel [Stenotrophomonas sp.]|nr:bestrophin family ion channel [Stenotrophomonas sp.]